MSNMHSRGSTWHRVKILGKGSFGSVFLVKLPDRSTLIAAKTAKLEESSSLIKENKILECFRNCPEIVGRYGHETTLESGLRYYNLFMEYAPFGDLLDLMAQTGGRILQESAVQTSTRMILKGLSCIHAKRIVHCDIKPENILVFPSGHGYELKITDFGLAKEPDEAVSESKKYSFRGTPAYMSPESVARGEIGTAMDIWALGCVVVVLITGQNPWRRFAKRLDPKKILSLLAFTEIMPEIPKDMSETGKDFLRKCLQRDPSKRWSAQKLLDHPYINGGTTTGVVVNSELSHHHQKIIKLPHEFSVSYMNQREGTSKFLFIFYDISF